MSITGGLIAFEDAVKHDGYADPQFAPARRARAEFRFDIDPTMNEDGISATINAVGEQAKAKVYELLGSPAPAAKARKAPAAPKPAPETSANAPAKLTDKDKRAIEAGLVIPDGTKPPVASAKQPDPAAMEDDFTVAAEDDLTQVAPEPVTDAELNSAVQKKNGEIKNPAAIRAVISGFNPDPSKQFTLAQITQDQRRVFLAKLKELKAT